MINLILFIPVFLLLLMDSIGNPQSSLKYLGFPAMNLILPCLLIQFILNYFWNIKFPRLVKNILQKVLLPILIGVTIVLTLLDFFIFPNFVFAYTRIVQASLGLLTITTGLFLLVNQDSKWWLKYKKRIIGFLPYVLMCIGIIIRLWPFDVFFELVKEDKIVEYLQFLVLLSGSIIILRMAYFKYSLEKKIPWAMIFFGVSFFLAAGDEISWGQRIFGLQTPEYLLDLNNQQETTIHNLHSVEWLVGIGYTAISLVGLFGKKVLSSLSFVKKRVLSFLPKEYVLGYFLFPALFFSLQWIMPGFWREWCEPMELFLYSGIVLWTIDFLK